MSAIPRPGPASCATPSLSYSGCAWVPPLLKRLESAGLISRTRDVEDERRVHITLSAGGRKLKAKAQKIPGCVLSATQCSIPEAVQLTRRAGGLHNRPDPLDWGKFSNHFHTPAHERR